MANDMLARGPHTANLSASSPEMLSRVRKFQDLLRTVEQVDVATEHVIHGGMYARTVRLAAGIVATGTVVNIPTLLIVHGDMDMLAGDEWIEVRGYGVFAGGAGRKAMFITRSAVEMTMVSATKAQTVEDAECELTREHEDLMSRKSCGDMFLVTGE